MKKIKIYFSQSKNPIFGRVNEISKSYFKSAIKNKNIDLKCWWVWNYRENSNNAFVFGHSWLEDLDFDKFQELWAKAMKLAKKIFSDSLSNNDKKNTEQTILVRLIFDSSLNNANRYFVEKWVLMAINEHNYFQTNSKNSKILIKNWNIDILDKDGLMVWKTKKDMKYNILGIKNKELEKIVQAIDISRELVNKPSNVINPDTLTSFVKDLFKWEKSVKLDIFGKDFLEKENMWLFLAVNQGSRYEPRMIIMDYNPYSNEKNKNEKTKNISTNIEWQQPIVLVGKWLTYDTGWLYAKPEPHMNEMHWDMWWSATVIALIWLAQKLGIKKRIIWAIGVTDNAIDANSYCNWDILSSRSGKTVEVWHTDAEWRLVLADVLNYMDEKYDPKYIFDFATLTGACRRALGEMYTGVFGFDEKLISKIKKIWDLTNDKVWNLPLDRYCLDAVKSDLADLSNIGKWKWLMWASTAWAFLSNFVNKKQKRLHFDIAGTCLRQDMKREYDIPKGIWTWAMISNIISFLKSL